MTALRGPLVVGLLLGWADTRAALPPPDPAHGDRYDGRPAPRADVADDLKLLPRLILVLPRTAFKVLGWPVRGIITFDERYRVKEHLARWFTSSDGRVGVRPALSYVLRLSPTGGVTFFDRAHLGGGRTFSLTLAGGAAGLLIA